MSTTVHWGKTRHQAGPTLWSTPVTTIDPEASSTSSTLRLEERSGTHLRWPRPPGNTPEPLESLFVPGYGEHPAPMKPGLRHYLEKFGSQGNYCDRCVWTAGFRRARVHFRPPFSPALSNLHFTSSGVPGPNLRAAGRGVETPLGDAGNTKASSSTLLSARAGTSHNSWHLGYGPSPNADCEVWKSQ